MIKITQLKIYDKLPIVLWLSAIHRNPIYRWEGIRLFFSHSHYHYGGFKNWNLMVYLQRLLPSQIKIPSSLHRHDCIYHSLNHPLSFAIHLQLFYIQFRQLLIYLQNVLLWIRRNHLLYLYIEESQTSLCTYHRPFKTKNLDL